jgi:hypothetical protein
LSLSLLCLLFRLLVKGNQLATVDGVRFEADVAIVMRLRRYCDGC